MPQKTEESNVTLYKQKHQVFDEENECTDRNISLQLHCNTINGIR